MQERNEWGDPLTNLDVWRYIRSYSPIDNLRQAWGKCYGSYVPGSSLVGNSFSRGPAASGRKRSRHLSTANEAKASGPLSKASKAVNQRQSFPHIMVTASRHDPRVPFHGPAKYVALVSPA